MTARIETRTGEVVSEIVAPRTELIWDALTNGGYVRFHLEKLTTLDGALISREPAGTLEHPFDLLMARTWDVPDGQGGVIPVPTALLMGAIKVALDVLYNERAVAVPDALPGSPEAA